MLAHASPFLHIRINLVRESTRLRVLVQLICKVNRQFVAISVKPKTISSKKYRFSYYFPPLNNR